jgi:hypothetical protein
MLYHLGKYPASIVLYYGEIDFLFAEMDLCLQKLQKVQVKPRKKAVTGITHVSYCLLSWFQLATIHLAVQ